MANPTGEYHGRLACDGTGNLLADEGEYAGFPVAYDHEINKYMFVQPGEPSHNERYHQRYVETTGTVDSSQTGDESLVNAGGGENMHHFEVQEDDAHYDGIKSDPDTIAATITSHTDAYTGGE